MARAGFSAHGVLSRLGHIATVVVVVAVMVPLGTSGANAQALTADTYWVDNTGGIDAPGRGSEAEPFETITYAEAMSDELDMIMVAEGTYSEATGEAFPLYFSGQSLVSAYGPAVTILYGNGTEQMLIFGDWDDGDQLNGFTIENGGIPGNAAAVQLNLTRPTAFPTEPTVTDCTFTNNTGGFNGGALVVNSFAGAALVVRSNQFWNNSASEGGAIRATTYGSLAITSNEFSQNTATRGGAIHLYTDGDAAVTLDWNTFTSNSANTVGPDVGVGGAVHWVGATPAVHQMADNVFDVNTAAVGGAVYLKTVALHMDANEAGGNSASSMGSFAYLEDADVIADNNYLVQNIGANNGIVWTVDPNSTLAEMNDTVVGNWGAQYAAYADPSAAMTITNCIYWNPQLSGTLLGGVHGADSISYSCSSDDLATLTGYGNTVGAGMVYAEPVYHADGPPRLAQDSPCVDAGTLTGAPAHDFYGTSRPLDGNGDGVAKPDIGCHEAPAVTPPAPPYVPIVVYRFFHYRNGTHFYTPDPEERARVIANWSSIYRDEGVAYVLNAASATQPLYRFFNLANGSHFYTADITERERVRANWPNIYRYEGETYPVSPVPVPGATPVYRFFKYGSGSHFYTADVAERDRVRTTWPTVYRYEGEAFWLAP